MKPLDHCPKCAWDRLAAEHNTKMSERRRILALLRKHFAIAPEDPAMVVFFAEVSG